LKETAQFVNPLRDGSGVTVYLQGRDEYPESGEVFFVFGFDDVAEEDDEGDEGGE
jgi:hypothetical protein